MRRNIVHEGAGQLRYEIREIVEVAKKLEAKGQSIIWENIGDPVQKGESVAPWIRLIVTELASDSRSYAYDATVGNKNTREFLADRVNLRGGAQITSDDIVFFNGLGDAVALLFSYLRRESRVLGPSPAYSTLSSAEAAHSGYDHTTYKLDFDKGWMPDLNDMENKIKYNDAIAGILLINPDNPTGAVYPKEVLEQIVALAKKYDLFVMADETYAGIIYEGVETASLSEVIGDVPGIALRSISKEYPWPGGRCGWMEVFNQDKDENFKAYIKSIIDAKRLQVCSTTLPQISIPRVLGDPRHKENLRYRTKCYESRAEEAMTIFKKVKGVKINKPKGAFYLTLVFEEGVLGLDQSLVIENAKIREEIEKQVKGSAPDKRFVYYLLGASGICVVPLSGFCSTEMGFRMTLLEADDEKRLSTLKKMAEKIKEYLESGELNVK